MEGRVMNIVCRPSTTLLIVISAACFLATASSQAVMKGGYYPSWAQDYFPPSSIDTTLFTHIYYAFLTPNTQTFSLEVTPAQATFLPTFTSTLNPRVRTLFSVNVIDGDISIFTRMATDQPSRAAFIRSSIEVARRFGFNGVDLDWEYPQTSTEMDNYGRLLDEWRVEVQREAAATGQPPLLLSAAVWYSNVISGDIIRSYPAASVNNNLDWVNVMCYDFVGSWVNFTGAHAALYNPGSDLSTSNGMDAWIGAGVARSKLVMGMPLFGRTWQLADPGRARGIGAPAVGPGPGADGAMIYSDVVSFNAANNAEVVYDSATVSVYSVAGTSWISYDDVRSVAVKIGYAQQLGIRGYFFWTVVGDNNWEVSGRASQLWS